MKILAICWIIAGFIGAAMGRAGDIETLTVVASMLMGVGLGYWFWKWMAS